MLKYALNFFAYIMPKIKNQNWNTEEIKQEILDFLFPPICGICGKINKDWICEKCYKRIEKYKASEINRYLCKNKIKQEYENIKTLYYEKLIYIFPYKKLIRNLIIDYKFNNKAYISNLFATVILKDDELCRKINFYDIIIPVPMFEKKKKQRGYNQTELIAEKIGKRLNIKLETNCVIKSKNTKVQSLLNAQERKENIKNAFFVNNKDKIKDKKIIIFDDIFTTGETANEISKKLKLAGAKDILVLVLAKD